jgi:hypothetical protein
MTAIRLRVGVATDTPVTLWQARCIDRLAAVPGVTIERWFQLAPDRPLRDADPATGARSPVEVPDALRAIPPEDSFGPTSGEAESGARVGVDVLLDLSTRSPGPPTGWAPEVWRFRYGDRRSRDAARVGLLDYVRGPGVTRVALVDEPTGAVLRDGWLQTVSWWTGRPLEGLLLDPADWPALVALERTDPAFLVRDPTPTAGNPTASPPVPHGDRATGVPARILSVAAIGRRMRGWVDVVGRQPDWNVGIVSAPIERLPTEVDADVNWLPLRPGHYAADPFGIERDGTLHILFEDYDQRRGKGSINHVAIGPDGSVSEPTPALDLGVHASYPFLVEHDGAVFMLPETSAAGELVLYEAIDFPLRWQRASTLLPGIPAVDPSVIEYAGRWWMFATRADRGANQNLFIWHAPRLTGPWTAHAANPVKTDARSARPGGTPFVVDGRLYRPSQDNSRSYGGRLIVNRVEVLTPTAFSERPDRAIEPRPGSRYPDGLHTLSAAGDRTLIDGNRLHFVPDALRRNVDSKLPKRRGS